MQHARQSGLSVQTGEAGLSLADPTAWRWRSTAPLAYRGADAVEIECASELTRGMTVVDRLSVAADDNNRVTWSAALKSGAKAESAGFDSARFKAMLKRALAD